LMMKLCSGVLVSTSCFPPCPAKLTHTTINNQQSTISHYTHQHTTINQTPCHGFFLRIWRLGNSSRNRWTYAANGVNIEIQSSFPWPFVVTSKK
jgi:hypothetical protein